MKHCVLLTRPSGDNEGLARLLNRSGIASIERPMLEIRGLEPDAAARSLAMSLAEYDKIIFISRNAVNYGMALLEPYWPQWPMVDWFAIGRATAARLEAFDIRASFAPGGDSDALLELPGLDRVNGRSVLIVKGRGGRERLAEVLRSRGARVDHLDVYERIRVNEGGRLADLFDRHAIDVVIITSAESMYALSDSLHSRELGTLQVVVPSERVAIIARELGCRYVHVAGHADESSLHQASLKAIMQIETLQSGRESE